MKVNIKKFDVQMDVKQNGLEFEVRDNQDNHLGDLVLTKTRLIWCHGRTHRKSGKTISWEKFIRMMEARE